MVVVAYIIFEIEYVVKIEISKLLKELVLFCHSRDILTMPI
jgi:hypothetical protein